MVLSGSVLFVCLLTFIKKDLSFLFTYKTVSFVVMNVIIRKSKCI